MTKLVEQYKEYFYLNYFLKKKKILIDCGAFLCLIFSLSYS